MMISPQSYRDQHRFCSLAKLKLIRRMLLRDINKLQKEIDAGVMPTVIKTPSRETRVSVYKEYLVEINKLIKQREKMRFWERLRRGNKEKPQI